MHRVWDIPLKQVLRGPARQGQQPLSRICIDLRGANPRQSGLTANHPRVQQERVEHQKRRHAQAS